MTDHAWPWTADNLQAHADAVHAVEAAALDERARSMFTDPKTIGTELEQRGWEVMDAAVQMSGPEVVVRLDGQHYALMGIAQGPWGFDVWEDHDMGTPGDSFTSTLEDDVAPADVAAWFDTTARLWSLKRMDDGPHKKFGLVKVAMDRSISTPGHLRTLSCEDIIDVIEGAGQ